MEASGVPQFYPEGTTQSRTYPVWIAVLKQWGEPDTYESFELGRIERETEVPLLHVLCNRHLLRISQSAERAKYGLEGLHKARTLHNKKRLKFRFLDRRLKEVDEENTLDDIGWETSEQDPLIIHFIELTLEEYFQQCVPRRVETTRSKKSTTTSVHSIVKPIYRTEVWNDFLEDAQSFSACKSEYFSFYDFPEFDDNSTGHREPCNSESRLSAFLHQEIHKQAKEICNQVLRSDGYEVGIAQAKSNRECVDYFVAKSLSGGGETTNVAAEEVKMPDSLDLDQFEKAKGHITSGNVKVGKSWPYLQAYNQIVSSKLKYGILTSHNDWIFLKLDWHRKRDGGGKPRKLYMSPPVTLDNKSVPLMKALCYFIVHACKMPTYDEEAPEREGGRAADVENIRRLGARPHTQEHPRRSPRMHIGSRRHSKRRRGTQPNQSHLPWSKSSQLSGEKRSSSSPVSTMLDFDDGSSDSGQGAAEDFKGVTLEELNDMWDIVVGEGGGSIVYRAVVRGRDCAIKTVPLGNRRAISMLENEIRMYRRLKRLQGTVIPEVVFIAKAGSWMMLGVQYIEGHTYSDEVDAEGIVKEEAKRLLSQIHSEKVAHGDVRAPNLLVDSEGNVRWIDLGMARLSSDPEDFLLEERDLAEMEQ